MIIHLIFICLLLMSLYNIFYSFNWSKKVLNRDGWNWGPSHFIIELFVELVRMLPIKLQKMFLICFAIFTFLIILGGYILYFV